MVDYYAKKRRMLRLKRRLILASIYFSGTIAITYLTHDLLKEDDDCISYEPIIITPENIYSENNVNLSSGVYDMKNNSYFSNIMYDEQTEPVSYIRDNSNIIEKLYAEEENESEVFYFDCLCPEEDQDIIRNAAKKYNVPFEVMMVIGDQESDGNWNNNGVISKTNDYGVFQINKINLKTYFEKFGAQYNIEEYEDFELAMQNDKNLNIEVAAYHISTIFEKYNYTIDCYDLENICGTYNGWTRWREKTRSLNYVAECLERWTNIFGVSENLSQGM